MFVFALNKLRCLLAVLDQLVIFRPFLISLDRFAAGGCQQLFLRGFFFFSIRKGNGLSLNWEWPKQIKEKISLRCRSYFNKYNHCKSQYPLYCNCCLIRSFKQTSWSEVASLHYFKSFFWKTVRNLNLNANEQTWLKNRWVISCYNSLIETVAMRCKHFSWFTKIKNVSVLRLSLSCAVIGFPPSFQSHAKQVEWHVLKHPQVWICVGSKNHLAASQWVSPCLPQGVCWERLQTFTYQTGISV